MRRNAKGSNHPMATFFLNPPNNFVLNDDDGCVMEGDANDMDSALTTLASSTSSTMLQG
mgnify:CR=1 FL=1